MRAVSSWWTRVAASAPPSVRAQLAQESLAATVTSELAIARAPWSAAKLADDQIIDFVSSDHVDHS